MKTEQEAKKEIRGCTLVFFRYGADTIDQVDGRKAHRLLADGIGMMYRVTKIGTVAWLDAPSWIECHA